MDFTEFTFLVVAAVFLTCFSCWLRRLLSKRRTSKEDEDELQTRKKDFGGSGPEVVVILLSFLTLIKHELYSAKNLEKTIRFSLKSWLSERFHSPEMSQIKAEINLRTLRTNLKLIFHKNVGWQ